MSLKNLQDWNSDNAKAVSAGCGTKPSACGSKASGSCGAKSSCGAKNQPSSCGAK